MQVQNTRINVNKYDVTSAGPKHKPQCEIVWSGKCRQEQEEHRSTQEDTQEEHTGRNRHKHILNFRHVHLQA